MTEPREPGWEGWAPLGPGYRHASIAMLMRVLVARHGLITITRDEFERALASKVAREVKPMMKLDLEADALLLDLRPVTAIPEQADCSMDDE